MTIQQINKMSQAEAFNAFEKCCASTTWINRMIDSMPFSNENDIYAKGESNWEDISLTDWLEACDGHPKIGDVTSLKEKYSSTKQWAGNEQQGMDSASDEIINRLAQGNQDYEDKFGYIFIVCATGKSATEMCEILEKRLPNDVETELEIAKGEQNKITKIRLEKLLTT